jgi:regulator of sigma E protease
VAPKANPRWALGIGSAAGLEVVAYAKPPVGSAFHPVPVEVGEVLVSADGIALDRWTRLAMLPSVRSLVVRGAAGERTVDVSTHLSNPEQVARFLEEVRLRPATFAGAPIVVPSGGGLEGGVSPAGAAGLLPGDRLLEIDGKRIGSWSDVIAARAALNGSPVTLKVRTGDQPERTLRVQPKAERDPAVEGERSAATIVRERVAVNGPLDTVGLAFSRTVGEVRNTFRVISRFIGGDISFQKNVAGPLTIANLSSRSASEGIPRFLVFLAFISVNLAVLNILPIPVLDGGHLLFLLIEKVRGGRPLSEAAIAKAQLVGFALLMLLMVFALRNDVVNVFG